MNQLTSDSRRFAALDGWRGLAALAIAFYHAPIDHPLRHAAGWKNLELFVDFFFVLSGFVICHAWGARLTGAGAARDFMLRRFWRIWPLHFCILAAFLVIELAKSALGAVVALPLEDAPFTGSRSWLALLTNIGMVQALNLHGTTTWNGPAWSISVEFWTYLVFALTMLAFRRHAGRALVGVALGALAGVAIFSPIQLFATHDFGLLRAIYGFFLGAATYRLVRSERFEINGGTAVEVTVVLLLASYLMVTGVNITSLFAPLVFAGVIVVFSRGAGAISALLESEPVQALGRWSYSIYLVHVLLFYGARLALIAAEKVTNLPLTASGTGAARVFSSGSGPLDLMLIAGLIGLTIAVSSRTYRFIEAPFMAAGGANRAQTPGLNIAPA